MILCGGKGTRLRDVSEILPKPMVPIGEQPIVWHIMRTYAAFGVNRFILCLGYKKEEFIDYFLNFHAHATDITIRLGDKGKVTYHNNYTEADWEVTLAHTGEETMTGGRVRIASRHLKSTDSDFFLTYGDGVSDVNIAELVEFHKSHGKMATLTAINIDARFGVLDIGQGGNIQQFREKSQLDGGVINGGFMVLQPEIIDLIEGDKTVFERYPLETAAERGELMAYRHKGFWHCMDTLRDKNALEEMWASGSAPWKVWKD